MSKVLFRKAESYLSGLDPKMAGLIKSFGPCTFSIDNRSKFEVLINSVISQQLSGKAASSIRNRLNALLLTQAGNTLTAQMIVAADVNKLSSCGISESKANCILRIANDVQNQSLNLDDLVDESDEDVVAILTRIKGIGPWTAEMFLMFGLHRMDVFSLRDAGLKRALINVYAIPKESPDERILAITTKWKPYRSVASWYLWRSLD